MLETALLVGLLVWVLVVQRILRTWVARRWLDDRIGNVTAVLILLGSSSFGVAIVVMLALAILQPSVGTLVSMLPIVFLAVVVFGFAMTAINYASAHGVREHMRAQRDRERQQQQGH